MVFQKGNDDHGRNRAQNLGKSFHKEVDFAAEVTGNRSPNNTNDKVCDSDNRCEDKGESCTVCKASEDVLTGIGGAEQEQGLFNAVLLDLIVLVNIILVYNLQVMNIYNIIGLLLLFLLHLLYSILLLD